MSSSKTSERLVEDTLINAAAVWVRILFFTYSALSWAMSASIIVDTLAVRFSIWVVWSSNVLCNLFITAPSVAFWPDISFCSSSIISIFWAAVSALL